MNPSDPGGRERYVRVCKGLELITICTFGIPLQTHRYHQTKYYSYDHILCISIHNDDHQIHPNHSSMRYIYHKTNQFQRIFRSLEAYFFLFASLRMVAIFLSLLVSRPFEFRMVPGGNPRVFSNVPTVQSLLTFLIPMIISSLIQSSFLQPQEVLSDLIS